MPNLIPDVERIEKEMQLGWPHGTYELHREIPTLLHRIRELENALIPFARVAHAEGSNPNPNALVNVYLSHCWAAFDKVDPNQGVRHAVDDFFSMPAEG